ncbi:MAG: hypothetical protein WBD25_03590 [Terriglobales bacterium]|jgi:hypothetical protein
MLETIDAWGVFPLLLQLSGYAAMERGSEWIEPLDLIKAIYIADLEHVSAFWNTWEGFERLVNEQKLANGRSGTYINRTLYLVRVELAMRDSPDGFVGLGRASLTLQHVVSLARKFASERSGTVATPSSRDLVFATCSLDSELSECLQKSGLQLAKLADAVTGKLS